MAKTKKTYTATSPDGATIATFTTTRDVAWLTWAKWNHAGGTVSEDEVGVWFHVGGSSAEDYAKARRAAKGTNPHFDETDATPAELVRNQVDERGSGHRRRHRRPKGRPGVGGRPLAVLVDQKAANTVSG